MIPKINMKYFSPFTPIADIAKSKAKNAEQRLVYSAVSLIRRDAALPKDTFVKFPEIFY